MEAKRWQHSRAYLHTERILDYMHFFNLTFERLGNLVSPPLSTTLTRLTVYNERRGLYTQQKITEALSRLGKIPVGRFYKKEEIR